MWRQWWMYYKHRLFFAVKPILLWLWRLGGKPVNIKKGQFLAPGDMRQVVNKAKEANGGADTISGMRAWCFVWL